MKTFLESIKVIALILTVIIVAIGTIQALTYVLVPQFEEGEYTMVYKVYYPNNTKEYTIKNELPIRYYSGRGTNYITKFNKVPFFKHMYSSPTVFETTAPIEVVSYTFKEKPNN